MTDMSTQRRWYRLVGPYYDIMKTLYGGGQLCPGFKAVALNGRSILDSIFLDFRETGRHTGCLGKGGGRWGVSEGSLAQEI